MIQPTRFTVDDATRKVLDELSGQLSHTPSWVAQLKDELEDQIRDTTRLVLTGPAKSLNQLQAHATSQQQSLAELRAALQQLIEDAGEKSDTLRASIDVHARQLAALGTDVRKLDDGAQRQQNLIGELRDERKADHERLIAASGQMTAAIAEQREALRAMSEAFQQATRHQEERTAQLTENLQAMHALLAGLQATQANQLDALQSVQQRVDELSRSRWKKLF
jgi:chromosome segregation ATPase